MVDILSRPQCVSLCSLVMYIIALMGKLCGVFCEDLGENWPCYNGTTLYVLCYCLAVLNVMTKLEWDPNYLHFLTENYLRKKYKSELLYKQDLNEHKWDSIWTTFQPRLFCLEFKTWCSLYSWAEHHTLKKRRKEMALNTWSFSINFHDWCVSLLVSTWNRVFSCYKLILNTSYLMSILATDALAPAIIM